ncbi:response regulator transcription factor [Streptococcus halichoeri]|uniref:response regulator transcription factor n=1 Tax=Streptococcus halichoeri TaxID=254785 RepID=UPI0013588D22|nr:response regulator transcription factor [Streptococcus halichoeri]
MNIFILEDNFIQQAYLEKIIEEVKCKRNIHSKTINTFEKPAQLLESICEKGMHNLFFLDIEIKNEERKGLEVARQIRQIDPYAQIVFVTNHSELMPLTFRYQVSALDYIDKELSKEKFSQRVENVLLYASSACSKTLLEDSFYFKSRYNQVQVPFNDILYIETSLRSHRVVLYTEKDRMEFTATLENVLKQEPRLFQCHRSFLVNPLNVFKVDKSTKLIYFKNGANCLISRNKIKDIMVVIEKSQRGRGI